METCFSALNLVANPAVHTLVVVVGRVVVLGGRYSCGGVVLRVVVVVTR